MNLSTPIFRRRPDQRGLPRLLMLTHRLPYPPDKGERIRSYHLLRWLSNHYQVCLASLINRPPTLGHWSHLEGLTVRMGLWPQPGLAAGARAGWSMLRGRSLTEGYFANRHLAEEIGRWHEEQPFDAALAVCSSMAGYLDGLDIRLKVLDLVDVDSAKWAGYARTSRGPAAWLYRLEARRLAAWEQALAGRFDHILLTSPTEARRYRRLAGSARVTVVGNGVDTDYFQPGQPVARPVAVFTGALNYKPNVDGLCWLAEQVWPRVRRQVPGAVLQLVGHQPERAVMRLHGRQGIQVVGPVPDVRPYLHGAAVAVAPLRQAHGVQNKVLEAMACSRAVLTMPAVAEAIGAEPGRHLATAFDADQWTGQLAGLLGNAEARQALGRAARQYVEQHCRWSQALAPLADLLPGPTVSAVQSTHRAA